MMKHVRKIEKAVRDLKRDGYTVFVHFNGGIVVVTTEEYNAAEDLRTLTGITIDLDTCGTPVKFSRSAEIY